MPEKVIWNLYSNIILLILLLYIISPNEEMFFSHCSSSYSCYSTTFQLLFNFFNSPSIFPCHLLYTSAYNLHFNHSFSSLKLFSSVYILFAVFLYNSTARVCNLPSIYNVYSGFCNTSEIHVIQRVD